MQRDKVAQVVRRSTPCVLAGEALDNRRETIRRTCDQMDTMTTTKVAASLCGALLVMLLGKWVAEGLYHDEGHGLQAYVIETDSDGGGEAAPEISFEELYAGADIEDGAKVFRKCSACHKLEAGANGTGPYLYGVVNRDVAAADGFSYSSAMASHGGTWTPEELSHFLEKPSSYMSGTSMSFAGLRKAEDRVNVIAYLESLSN